MKSAGIKLCLWAAISIALLSVNAAAQAPKGLDVDKPAAQVRKPIHVDKLRVIEHWTKERRAKAVPRDLVIDSRGLGYMKRPDGSLRPYGHDIAPEATPTNHSISPFAKPSEENRGGGKGGGGGGGGGGGSGDTTPPTITILDPTEGATIGGSHVFEARVTDTGSGVKSVTFHIQKSSSSVQSFSATRNRFNPDIWGANFNGFTNGEWTWWVEAKDNARKGGNTAISAIVNFKVKAIVGNGNWPPEGKAPGTVQTASGRLYFEMPDDSNRTTWSGYVCSGTVATDGTGDRSVILTAAHCVYDDVNKAFARNTLFIPDQAGTTGSGTDLYCGNDPMGCWVPSFGVVDANWANVADPDKSFPENMAWDFGLYVVADVGAHLGASALSDALDVAAKSLPVSFAAPYHDVANSSSDYTYAFGYSYKEDPQLRYCAEDMTTEQTSFAVSWWLDNCGLTGGSSGGAWLQPMDEDTGTGTIVSFNSWGYVFNGTELPGMAGPNLVSPLHGGTSSASCIFDNAKTAFENFAGVPSGDGNAGTVIDACP